MSDYKEAVDGGFFGTAKSRCPNCGWPNIEETNVFCDGEQLYNCLTCGERWMVDSDGEVNIQTRVSELAKECVCDVSVDIVVIEPTVVHVEGEIDWSCTRHGHLVSLLSEV